ncbi:MAG: hypothetical protein O7J95_06030, partial [Planctomycetota bacterium]|nr:hypothetical protein [Planctomycetota bacterium]
MLSGSRTAVFARLVCFLALTSMSLAPSTGRAATDGNGFFDTYLAAIGYDARGSTPQAQEMTQDYLCDGEVSEETILPQEGQLLQPPLTAADDPALCGSKPPARRGFDENALLDAGGLLPISVQAINNTTLDFRGIVRDATGMGGLTPSNVMAYAWVYVTNNTDAALDLTMGIGSDDSLQVEINRVEVFRHRGGRGSGGSGAIQDRFPVTLQPGGNLIQFKVWQGGGGWNMRARFETAGDCPLNARAPRDPIRSEEGGMITVDTVPVDVFEVTPSQRTIDASGASPNTVTANIRVTVDNQGAPWNLEETYDSGWELVTSNPAVSESVPGVARWNGVTAGEITYTLRRTDEWGPEDGTVAGRFTLGGAVSAVPGDAVIPGGLQPFVPEVLLTASLNIADFDELGNPADLDGCNVTPEQIRGAWIVGTAGGEAVTDASIVPSEGMAVQLDFGGLAGGMSQADSLSFISRDAETRYWADGIPEGAMILNRVTSGDGLYNFQRDDIYGPVDQTMNVAYFYALNLTGSARRLVIAFRSDDSGGVRVNGRSVHAITACRGTGSFDTADRFEAQLDPGKNLIACYTFERGGGYGMRIRFEDERFRPLRIPTTLDSAGYDPDPAAHPDPGELETFDSLFVPAVLVTAGFRIGGGFHGTNIPTRNIRGDWITGQDGNGDPVDDASIVPVEGMSLFPDFGGASQADGLTEIGQAGKDRFWTDPLDANVSGSLVVRVTSGDGFYNWQRGTIYGSSPDPNVTMNVAWFYAINEEAAPRCLTLSFGSDDSGGVRLNGRSVHAITVGRGTPAFAASDKVPVELGPGKNLIACYTFDNQGGWGLRVRFEDGDGNPVAVPTTTDPAGYDPDPAAHPAPGPDCSGEPAGDAYVRGGAANGIVSRFLVPRYVFEQIGGGRTNSMAAPENYVSQEGNPPAPDTIFEGAIIEAGVEGLADPFPPAITTGVRGSACGRNTLVLFDGLRDGDGANDPGDFNSNNFYPNVVR